MKLSNRDKEYFLKIALKAVRKAGEIQRRCYGKVRSIKYKGKINLLTEVDQASEDAILKIIRRDCPDHDILAEESGLFKKSSEFRWIVDPIDGTTNYAHSYPVFCSSIALEYRGEIVVGVVYAPVLEQLFVGVRGRGAKLNGKKIQVSKISSLVRSMVASGFAYNIHRDDDKNFESFQNFILKAQAVRRDGAAALDLCYVACGWYDGFWELGLWPWDVAAGSVILEEAGGKVSLYDGSYPKFDEKQIVASNGKIHKEMLKVLKNRRRCG